MKESYGRGREAYGRGRTLIEGVCARRENQVVTLFGENGAGSQTTRKISC